MGGSFVACLFRCNFFTLVLELFVVREEGKESQDTRSKTKNKSLWTTFGRGARIGARTKEVTPCDVIEGGILGDVSGVGSYTAVCRKTTLTAILS